MEFSSGWSVGWYFIPFANLWKPLKVMQEIWSISKNPMDWENETEFSIVNMWWSLWITSNALGQLSSRVYSNADSIESLKIATLGSIISSSVDMPLAIAAILLINKIDVNQELNFRESI